MHTELQDFAALAKEATLQLEGNQLTLRDTQGANQVNFVKATA
jgi:heat shock protein HslJ